MHTSGEANPSSRNAAPQELSLCVGALASYVCGIQTNDDFGTSAWVYLFTYMPRQIDGEMLCNEMLHTGPNQSVARFGGGADSSDRLGS